MPEAFDEIPAPIPLLTFAVVLLERSVTEEQNLPPGDRGSEISGKASSLAGIALRTAGWLIRNA